MERKDNSTKTMYEIIGKLAVKYSQLQYETEHSLNLLIAKNDFLVGPLLVKALSFAKQIEFLRKLSKYHFENDPDLIEQTKTLFKDIDKIRIIRNTLIHGNWDFDSFNTTGYVIVNNYNMRYDGKNDIWTYQDQRRFKEDELKGMLKQAHDVIERLKALFPVFEDVETRSWYDTASPAEIEKFIDDIKKIGSSE